MLRKTRNVYNLSLSRGDGRAKFSYSRSAYLVLYYTYCAIRMHYIRFQMQFTTHLLKYVTKITKFINLDLTIYLRKRCLIAHDWAAIKQKFVNESFRLYLSCNSLSNALNIRNVTDQFLHQIIDSSHLRLFLLGNK